MSNDAESSQNCKVVSRVGDRAGTRGLARRGESKAEGNELERVRPASRSQVQATVRELLPSR